jgi:hypothetical protein
MIDKEKELINLYNEVENQILTIEVRITQLDTEMERAWKIQNQISDRWLEIHPCECGLTGLTCAGHSVSE